MAQAITAAAFRTAISECADAIAAGTFDVAVTKYAVAEAVNAGLEAESHDGQAGQRRRENLEGLSKAIERARAVSDRADAPRVVHIKTGYGW